jgi:hypothetical protein
MSYGSREKPVSLDPFQTIISVNFVSGVSFLIVSYRWSDGQDFDTAAKITGSGISGLDNEEVGWIADQRYYVSIGGAQILTHSGDEIGSSGVESVAVNIGEMLKIKKIKTFVLRFRGAWYSERESGNVSVSVKLFRKGSLSVGSLSEHTVTGGTQIYSLNSSRNVTFEVTDENRENGNASDDYGPVGSATFTTPSKVIFT